MQKNTSFLPELQSASGKFDYPMTNDYMFRALCQKNNKALKGLISALLHIPADTIYSVVITNPIVLGEECNDKEFRLDVLADLNGDRTIDIEMQVHNLYDWPERSISYLSRVYDNLTHGSKYSGVKTAMHIGILDFTLFPENPALYSCNKIMDEKTYHIYSDKFALNVLDLSKVELATDEDRRWKLDYWARLFKATTWEEIKMIASDDEYLKEASNTLYTLNADFIVRERCRNREEYYNLITGFENTIKEKDTELKEKNIELKEKENEIRQKNIELKQLREQIEQMKADQIRMGENQNNTDKAKT